MKNEPKTYKKGLLCGASTDSELGREIGVSDLFRVVFRNYSGREIWSYDGKYFRTYYGREVSN